MTTQVTTDVIKDAAVTPAKLSFTPVTTTGSPASGNLTKFSAAGTITSGDLSGDVVTSGTLVATVQKVNGVVYSSGPSTNTVPVVTSSNTVTYQTVNVAAGGTGNTSLTAYAPVFGGTTLTGAVQSGAVGTAGQVLTSNGAGAIATFQALPAGLPAAVTGTLSGASTTFTVDFTTYSAYIVNVVGMGTGTPGSTINIDVSSNGGSSYVTAATGGTGLAMDGSFNVLSGSFIVCQNLTTAAAALSGSAIHGTTLSTYVASYPTSAAINRVKFSADNNFTVGKVVLQPISLR